MATIQELCSLINSDEFGKMSATQGQTVWHYSKSPSRGKACYSLIKVHKGKITARLVMFEPCNDWLLGIIHRLYKRTTKPSSVPSNIY